MKATATVIIPVKNEPYLPTLLNQLSDYEVLIQTEPGLSNAVLHGVAKAKTEKIVICDGDGAHNPKYILAMLKLLDNGYDIVVGSRYINGGHTEDAFTRQILSRFFNRLARVILQINVADNMSGYIATKQKVFQTLNLKPFGYKFALEIIYKSKGKFNITEYPITFEKRKLGKSKTNWKEGLRTLQFIIHLRLENFREQHKRKLG